MRLPINKRLLCEKDEQLQLLLSECISEKDMPVHVAKIVLETKIANKQNLKIVWKNILKLTTQTA